MDAQVTEDMVRAAHHKLPGISNRVRVRQALEAAVALLPHGDGTAEVPVTARVLVHLDPDHIQQQITEAIERWSAGQRYDTDGRMLVAAFDAAIPADEPHVIADGITGPGVTSATGQTGITITEPRVLAGLAEIAAHLQVGRSTVAGWIKNSAANSMPGPIAILSCGPVYDLDEVTAWHRAWKGTD